MLLYNSRIYSLQDQVLGIKSWKDPSRTANVGIFITITFDSMEVLILKGCKNFVSALPYSLPQLTLGFVLSHSCKVDVFVG